MSSGGISIELPFPPASLSGHNSGHWKGKAGIVAKHREWAKFATMAVDDGRLFPHDIPISVTFYPPDKRSDRVNFANRMKPYFDGIADALGVNDSRFLPSYHFAEPIKGGKIIVRLEPWDV